MNNQQLIDDITQRIVQKVDPERLILFGSRARGDERPDSDVDLLVVMETDARPVERGLPIRQALRGVAVGKDIIVYTPREFQAWLGASLSLVSRAVKEGKVLYRKSQG